MKTKTIDRLWTLGAVISSVGGLAILIALVIVAAHFVRKYW
jgi:flagellin-like protein